jgi:tagatose 6-phosphate kinase
VTSNSATSYEFDIVIVSPNAALDSYYVLPALDIGEVNRSQNVLHTAGGKGNNMARAVTMLGGRALSLGIVGGNSGSFIIDELKREDIVSDMVWVESETRRSSTIIEPSRNKTTPILEAGRPVGEEARKQLTAKVLQHVSKAPFITFVGSLPPDFPKNYYADLTLQLLDEDVRVALDTAGEPLMLASRGGPAIIKINREEFQAAFASQHEWDWSIGLDIYSGLSEQGLDILIITDGPQGAYVFSKESPPFRVFTVLDKWVCTTGAGDTFLAGLLLSLKSGKPVKSAVCWATAAAAANLQQVGCGILKMTDLEKFLDLIKVEILH